MAKRQNVDESKNEPEAPAKRARKPTGFRTARPRPHESQSVTAGSSSSSLTTSRITTLVLGPNGRLVGKRKNRTHITAQSTLSTPPPNQVDATAVDAPEDGLPDMTENGFQSAEAVVQIETKPKRKRDNTTQVSNCILTIAF